jgi:hypothetical protein
LKERPTDLDGKCSFSRKAGEEQRIDVFLIHSDSRHQIIPDLAASIRECLSYTLDRISDSYKIASGGNTAGGNNRAFHVEFTCITIHSDFSNLNK